MMVILSILNSPEQTRKWHLFSNMKNNFSFDYHTMFQLMLESLQKSHF